MGKAHATVIIEYFRKPKVWIPACAGMTERLAGMWELFFQTTWGDLKVAAVAWALPARIYNDPPQLIFLQTVSVGKAYATVIVEYFWKPKVWIPAFAGMTARLAGMWELFFQTTCGCLKAADAAWASPAIYTENFRRLSFYPLFSWAKPTLQCKPIRQKVVWKLVSDDLFSKNIYIATACCIYPINR